jgi:acid stress-induced BolA-like protein IbaG/YrbA
MGAIHALSIKAAWTPAQQQKQQQQQQQPAPGATA